MPTSSETDDAMRANDEALSALCELLDKHNIDVDVDENTTRLDAGRSRYVHLDDLPAAVALDIAWALHGLNLRQQSANSTSISFVRRKAGCVLEIRLNVDDDMALVKSAADAALRLRSLMEAGNVEQAVAEFGFAITVDWQTGKKGRAYQQAGQSAQYRDQGANFGMLDRFDDKPHTLTLATLLTDAVARGEGKTRTSYATQPERACAVLKERPELVDVAAALDVDVNAATPQSPPVSVRTRRATPSTRTR